MAGSAVKRLPFVDPIFSDTRGEVVHGEVEAVCCSDAA